MTRDYKSTKSLLNSRKARAKPTIDAMRGSDDMLQWMELLGNSPESLKNINVIHVAGTNGKGSTCAFIESLLTAHSVRTGSPPKIGLYTSPHLTCIRERIQIDSQPVSEEAFTARFYEVWDRLPSAPSPSLDIPRYLQILALLAFHTFIKEKAGVAIIETHCGGMYDATNIVPQPAATAVTSTSLDHIRLLGPTIEDIAWHKGGIFKAGTPAFSSAQNDQVERVLRRRAAEKGTTLEVVSPQDTKWPVDLEVQRPNFDLAVALSNAFLISKCNDGLMAEDLAPGITRFKLPGRFQRLLIGGIRWFLDGAHNEAGIDCAAHCAKVLIFSHFSERDGVALLKALASALHRRDVKLQHVVLSSYDERRDGSERICIHPYPPTMLQLIFKHKNKRNRFSPEKQRLYEQFWRDSHPMAHISLTSTIEEALEVTKTLHGQYRNVDAFVTGSLQLVGGALYLLQNQ